MDRTEWRISVFITKSRLFPLTATDMKYQDKLNVEPYFYNN